MDRARVRPGAVRRQATPAQRTVHVARRLRSHRAATVPRLCRRPGVRNARRSGTGAPTGRPAPARAGGGRGRQYRARWRPRHGASYDPSESAGHRHGRYRRVARRVATDARRDRHLATFRVGDRRCAWWRSSDIEPPVLPRGLRRPAVMDGSRPSVVPAPPRHQPRSGSHTHGRHRRGGGRRGSVR